MLNTYSIHLYVGIMLDLDTIIEMPSIYSFRRQPTHLINILTNKTNIQYVRVDGLQHIDERHKKIVSLKVNFKIDNRVE